MQCPVLIPDAPIQSKFGQVREVVAIVHDKGDLLPGSPIRQIAHLHVNRGKQHLDVPELWLLAPPSIDDSPGRIADDAFSRHVVNVIKKMERPPEAAASVLGIAARHKEGVVHPRPYDARLNILAGLDGIPDGYQRPNVIVAVPRIDPRLPRIAPQISLKRRHGFIPHDRYPDILALFHALEADWIVHG